jgi:hypothetical protein
MTNVPQEIPQFLLSGNTELPIIVPRVDNYLTKLNSSKLNDVVRDIQQRGVVLDTTLSDKLRRLNLGFSKSDSSFKTLFFETISPEDLEEFLTGFVVGSISADCTEMGLLPVEPVLSLLYQGKKKAILQVQADISRGGG